MFASLAYAQDAAAAVPPASPLTGILPLVLIFVVFYFFLIRPQQKKLKEHQALIVGIKKGDKVLLGGGIYGTVAKLEGDDALMVEIAPSVTVRVARGTVAGVIGSKPANDNK